MGGVLSSTTLHFFLKIISALQRVLCTQIYRKYCKNSCSNTKLSESLASSSFAWVFSKSSQPNSTINYLHFVHRPYLEVQSTNSLPGEWISTFSRKSLLYSPLTQLCKLFPVKNTNTNTRIHKCTNANTIVAVRFQLFPLTCLACKIRAYIHKCEVKRSTCDSFRNNHNFVEFQKCYEHLILQPAMPAITSQIKICDQQASK